MSDEVGPPGTLEHFFSGSSTVSPPTENTSSVVQRDLRQPNAPMVSGRESFPRLFN